MSPVTSDFRLFVPVILRQLGPEGVARIMEEARDELGLGPQAPAWQTAAKYICGWADAEISAYNAQPGNA